MTTTDTASTKDDADKGGPGLRLRLSEVERDLLVCALEVWRWQIAEDYDSANTKQVYFNSGQRQAGRITVRRIDAMLQRLKDMHVDAVAASIVRSINPIKAKKEANP